MKNPQFKNDYQMNMEIAEKIIEIIERGSVEEWRKAWQSCNSSDLSELFALVVDGFCGVNIYNPSKTYTLIPDLVPAGFYVTFIDIKKHDLKLKKGSKGIPHYKPALYNKFFTQNQEKSFLQFAEDTDIMDSVNELINGSKRFLYVTFTYTDTKEKTQIFDGAVYYNKQYKKFYFQEFRHILEYFFKASDCGISNEDIKKLWNITAGKKKFEPVERIKKAEAVKNSYIERANLKFNEVAQDRAFYRPADHSVTVPTIDQFKNGEAYYQVLFHEFAHSTGYYKLLNRKGIGGLHGFGSVEYSKEELIAELSSLYTLTSLKLINDDILKNSIAYLKSWGEGLKKGIKHNILATIAQSRKATNLILNIDQD